MIRFYSGTDIKNRATSGDVSGSLPGPLTVNAIKGNAISGDIPDVVSGDPVLFVYDRDLNTWVPVELASAGGAGWQSWTPAYENITVGNGVEVARYIETADGLVIVQYMLTFGSSTTMGSNHTISLPVDADTSFTAEQMNMGPALLIDVGTTTYQGYVRQIDTGKVQVRVFNASFTHLRDNGITSVTPMAWVEDDVLSFNIRFERAP